jgi:hypothetical protein
MPSLELNCGPDWSSEGGQKQTQEQRFQKVFMYACSCMLACASVRVCLCVCACVCTCVRVCVCVRAWLQQTLTRCDDICALSKQHHDVKSILLHQLCLTDLIRQLIITHITRTTNRWIATLHDTSISWWGYLKLPVLCSIGQICAVN